MNTQQVVLTTSILAIADIASHRFVGFDGNIASASAKALGVCEADTVNGEACPINTHGIVLVTAGSAISVGAEVGVGADGKAVAGSGEGYALDAATADGDLIRIARGI